MVLCDVRAKLFLILRICDIYFRLFSVLAFLFCPIPQNMVLIHLLLSMVSIHDPIFRLPYSKTFPATKYGISGSKLVWFALVFSPAYGANAPNLAAFPSFSFWSCYAFFLKFSSTVYGTTVFSIQIPGYGVYRLKKVCFAYMALHFHTQGLASPASAICRNRICKYAYCG